MRRLFVALPMPDDIRDRLAELQGGVQGARWVDWENFHLTLRFIGEVDGGQAQDITETLSFLRAPAFDLTLRGVGHFEARGKVHALWADIVPEPSLLALHHKVETALAAIGVERDGRKFKPHVTLARMADAPSLDVARYEQIHNLFRAGPFAVEEFSLIESRLGRHGPTYHRDLDVPLVLEPMGVVASSPE